MLKGKIKNIVPNKEFGFIVEDGGKTEYFFHKHDFSGHWNDLKYDFETQGRLKIPVEFDIAESNRGPRAQEVRRLDYPNQA